jgi:hypothetical protein
MIAPRRTPTGGEIAHIRRVLASRSMAFAARFERKGPSAFMRPPVAAARIKMTKM